MSQALPLARPEGYTRAFLDVGVALCPLLERLAKRGTAASVQAGAHAGDLLGAFRRQRAAHEHLVASRDRGALDALTHRELEVLRLLTEGLTNKGIAERLVVAPSTVKQHLKNVYSKLDVHSRTQAVARGRELGLL